MIDELIAFYTARLDEAESAAKALDRWPTKGSLFIAYEDEDGTSHCGDYDPARVLRHIEAKRRIVADCQKYTRGPREFNAAHVRYGTPFTSSAANFAFRTLRSLAGEYADHPDYKPEWAL